jgi:hypothetical protein
VVVSISGGGRTVKGDGHELVEVAYVGDLAQAQMIGGLLETRGIVSMVQSVGVDASLIAFGVPNSSGGPQRVMVRAEQAQEARAVLAEVAAENTEEEWPEIANAKHLGDAIGRKPRNYGVIGGFARIYLSAFVVFAVAFGIFMLLRGG